MIVADVGAVDGGLARLFGRLDCRNHVEVVEDAREQRKRAREVHVDVEK